MKCFHISKFLTIFEHMLVNIARYGRDEGKQDYLPGVSLQIVEGGPPRLS